MRTFKRIIVVALLVIPVGAGFSSPDSSGWVGPTSDPGTVELAGGGWVGPT